MNARRLALLAIAVGSAFGCGKKTEVREDPSTKAIAAPSESASQTNLAAVDAEVDGSGPKLAPVKMIETDVEIQGLLAPEIVKKIVRINFPRLRECYRAGLKRDPDLKGTVGVRFVIDSKGIVESATSTGGSLKNKEVTDCIVAVYRSLSFLEPESGKVTVTYPIDFSAEDDSKDAHGHGMGYGGCPCGCDHSEDMVAELRGLDRGAALNAIDDSLHTIGEREDAGYITDRMVRHRLRLLAFGSELGRVGPARFTTIPAIRPQVFGTIASTKVRARFIFHGQTTELVNGKEKLLVAAFVLRLDLENGGDADVTLHAPTLEAKIPLPVSRWYVAGGDGQPWDGVLPARTKKLVNVIGYAGEPVLPGADVEATIAFESSTLHVKTRARKHWNQAD